MNRLLLYISILASIMIESCQNKEVINALVFQSSKDGDRFAQIEVQRVKNYDISIEILPEEKYQTIEGFGGSFTEASTNLLQNLSEKKRKLILEAYFGEEGARYSLTRTQIGSCDFSLSNYSYDSKPNDTQLLSFNIDHDKNDIVPVIKAAQCISTDGFKIVASPWTAPPWMKDNNDWKGGKLLPKYYETWATYFIRYLEEYTKEGIDIWGVTVENEPLGNNNNWESMHYTPQEMVNFVNGFLGPKMQRNYPDLKILGYDQNRNDELYLWAEAMYSNEDSNYFDGIALHWYASTYDYFPKTLEYVFSKAPDKFMIQTEACIDAEIPVWQNDEWYWLKEATDWGFDWAPAEQKYLHPKYAPVNRYAQDIIGCLNHHVNGWIDWNMVLDKQGGPNWAKNWCIAPVIVDTSTDEVYFTPLFEVMKHFSRFIRPGAKRIGFKTTSEEIDLTAVQNPDGSIIVIIFNPQSENQTFNLQLGNKNQAFLIKGNALQTIVIKQDNNIKS